MAKEKRRALADHLRCVGLLEEKAHLLYRNLADKVDLPFVRSLLLHIAYDSQKHSAILGGIADTIAESRVKTRDCKKRLGPTWPVIDDLAREISEEKALPRESIPSLVRKLAALESTAGEEYYVLVQLKTLRYMTKEIRETYDVDLKDLEDIFETIIRDEEIHATSCQKLRSSS